MSELFDRNRRLVAEVIAGEFMNVIGARYGISRERVRQICKRAGIDPPTGHVGLAKTRKEKQRKRDEAKAALQNKKHKLKRLVEEGESIASASRRLGFTRGQINTIAKQMGLYEISRFKRWTT